MKSYSEDLQTGLSNEKVDLTHLCRYFNREIKPTKDVYTRYDFYDKENLYELKTRNNYLNTFCLILKLMLKKYLILWV